MLPEIPPTARSAARSAALAALLLLILAGVVWLGVVAERQLVRLDALAARLDALTLAAETAPPADNPADQLDALTAAVAALGKKLDALAGDDAKAVTRLAGEVKNLTARIDVLAAAKTAAEKTAARPAGKSETRTPARSARPGAPDTLQPPTYGPGYPAWPAY
jgi:hypothetical protein